MLHAVEQPLPAPLRYASLPSPPPEPSAAVPASSSSHLTSADPPTMAIPPRHHILIVTGPAGCGKSTVAKLLADRYAFNYIEGDEVRSQRCTPYLNPVHY
jgi:gluconokinase